MTVVFDDDNKSTHVSLSYNGDEVGIQLYSQIYTDRQCMFI